jgi:hypothetical protein
LSVLEPMIWMGRFAGGLEPLVIMARSINR